MKKIILSLFLLIQFSDTKDSFAEGNIFKDNLDGTMTDTRTGLIWAKEPLSNVYTWKEAIEYIKKYQYNGYSDWRLPTNDEWKIFLQSTGKNWKELHNQNKWDIFIDWFNKQGFNIEKVKLDYEYWSSNLYITGHESQGFKSTYAHHVNLVDGSIQFCVITRKLNIWLVRGGNNIPISDEIDFINFNNKKIQILDDDFRGYISGDNVRLRKYPSIESEIIGYYNKGTNVVVRRRTKETYKINQYEDYWYLCDNYIGWIFGAYIKKENFNKSEYINNLPELKNIPKIYKEVQNYYYISCPVDSLVGERINCAAWCYSFTNKIISYSSPSIDSNYEIALVYKIISIDALEPNIIIKVSLLFTVSPFKTLEELNKIITITINKNINTIHFGDKIIYKHRKKDAE
jgi:hypothetical protein